ncbi:FecCD family ABC transporter permease [Williamsia muralis]|uniref:FecCD family ABC transporter permease n=1 Tax=Williamsia marianensis TaxID=85044 RepID=UPI000DE77027|nr:iron ABC transporter permease [Williamsia marianensis]PVY29481.1 iron complex transport system permease protein [Williamsia marianensis]
MREPNLLRPLPLLAGGTVVLVVLVMAHLLIGRSDLGAADTFRVLTGTSDVRAHEVIVLKYRLPRVLVGMGAGVLLALSGALLQAVIGNPLAEPGTTGVGAGAALGVVVTILAFPHQDMAAIASLVGAVIAGVLLYLVGRRSLAVAGILLGAILGAVTSLLLVVDAQPMGVVLRWLIGSLNARTQSDWNALWPWVLVLVVCALLASSRVNVLSLGDVTATGLGLRTARTRFVLLMVAVLAAAAAVTAAGAVAFIGLMAPHLARILVGGDYRDLIPVSMVLGAIGLSAADLLAFRITLDLPGSGPAVTGLPVGAVTASLGAPYLIWLVRKERR